MAHRMDPGMAHGSWLMGWDGMDPGMAHGMAHGLWLMAHGMGWVLGWLMAHGMGWILEWVMGHQMGWILGLIRCIAPHYLV